MLIDTGASFCLNRSEKVDFQKLAGDKVKILEGFNGKESKVTFSKQMRFWVKELTALSVCCLSFVLTPL